jgi:hypothetical protein
MTKKNSKRSLFTVIVLILVCLVVISFLLPPLLRVPICKGKILGFLRPYVQIFCPPKDLYDIVLNERIDISEPNKNQTFNFKIKYIGQYATHVTLDELDDKLYGKKYDLKLQMRLNFYKDGVLLISKNPADYYQKSWGLDRGDGEIKCDFEVPKDVPIDTNITCGVRIFATDPYLNNHCKGTRLFIHKYSEE